MECKTKSNKLTKQNLTQIQTPKGKVGGRVSWVKGVKCMVPEENWTLNGEHAIEYTDINL